MGAGATIGEAARILTLQAGFNAAVVVVGAALLGVAAGTIGAFALLRKRALMGDALSHATLPGVAGAFIVAVMLGGEGRSLPLLLVGATISGVLGVLTVQALVKYSRLNEDAAIGVVLSVFFGLGVVLISRVQAMDVGTQGGLTHFILGQTAAMRRSDAMVMGGVAVLVALCALLLFKEFRLVCFDREYAGALGWPVGAVDLAMMALVVVVTVIGLQAVGLILIVAMLIIPPAAARFWTERLWLMTLLSGVFGGLSGYLGASASAIWSDMPAGAVIVLGAGAIFVVSFIFAPSRGVLATLARHLRLRLTIATDHALRLAYEILESGGKTLDQPIAIERLVGARSWGGATARLLVRSLAWRGLVRTRAGAMTLTERGRAEAKRVTRNHRLWERFLIEHAELAPSHVDRAADLVEHALGDRLVAELEASLAVEGRLPSAHPIGPAAPERSA
ncbi:MAG: metal ABC transporter permease [Phycisphaerales bacterium]